MSKDPVLLKIIELLKMQGKTERSLLEAVHVSKNMFTQWKSNKSTSYWEHLDQIAEFLDVPADLLASDANDVIDTKTMTLEEMRLVRLFRELGRERKALLMDTAEVFTKVGTDSKEKS